MTWVIAGSSSKNTKYTKEKKNIGLKPFEDGPSHLRQNVGKAADSCR